MTMPQEEHKISGWQQVQNGISDPYQNLWGYQFLKVPLSYSNATLQGNSKLFYRFTWAQWSRAEIFWSNALGSDQVEQDT